MATVIAGKSCDVCASTTKYQCLRCSIAICNNCSIFEENEDVSGWKPGKAVGYCDGCFILNRSKQPVGVDENLELEDNPTKKGTTFFI